jgi:hypothetical protein
MATKYDMGRVTTKCLKGLANSALWSFSNFTFDVTVDPFQGFFNIKDTKVLDALQFYRVWRREYTLASVEADIDYTFASEIVALELRVTARSCDHGTAIHIYKHLQQVRRMPRLVLG